jgi:integrase
VWASHVGPTKSAASENSIPVLPLLSKILSNRRERLKSNVDDFIFSGPKLDRPLDFYNLSNRDIVPALAESPVEWKGFHGFRRGSGTHLIELGAIERGLLHYSGTQTPAQLCNIM